MNAQRPTFFLTVLFLIGGGPLFAAPQKPNVVVLFADDAGYADFGFQEHAQPDMAHLTPHIDSIASAGATFTQAYVTGAVCSPSRAGMMTGRYQERFGHETNLPPGTQSGLPLTETFGVKRLQGIGYSTGLIGKWHLGYPDAFHPNHRGYDHFYGLLQGSRSYYPYDKPSRDRVIRRDNIPTDEEGYITDRLGDAACEFIEEHQEDPFYLFVSFTAPHGPLEPRQGRYDYERIKHIDHEARRNYAGLVVAMDDNVGKILATLENQGLSESTIVIFTNDNGGPGGKDSTSNFPLRGHKGSLYEGGVRVPWAMAWPGVIQPGSVVDTPVITMDILPTIFDAAEEPIPKEWALDGDSLLPLIGASPAAFPKRTLYWRRHGSKGPIALQDAHWKLLERNAPDGKPELYNLANDVGEQHNLATQHPDVLARLQSKRTRWEAELVEPLWGPGSPGSATASN
ncbi:sulfatase-like hydrolase/transferase [Opitutaceae bacterium]|nr:sulfatase-like hydrolase/transferase [Opitutaceae bacterium]